MKRHLDVIVNSCSDSHSTSIADAICGPRKLEYQDKAAGINLHSVEMQSLRISEDKITGTFSGTATVNGKTGYSFTIVVEDNGEPGRDDKFTITIHEQL